jgi:hypothetical protein
MCDLIHRDSRFCKFPVLTSPLRLHTPDTPCFGELCDLRRSPRYGSCLPHHLPSSPLLGKVLLLRCDPCQLPPLQGSQQGHHPHCSHHPRARYQTIEDRPCVPEQRTLLKLGNICLLPCLASSFVPESTEHLPTIPSTQRWSRES